MYRAVVLSTLTLLLLAITGITVARENTFSPERGSQTESTVQDLTTTIGEPTTTTTREPADTAAAGPTQRGKPAAGSVIEESTEPKADEPEITEESEVAEVPEVTEEQATGGEGDNTGKPEGVGKPKGFGAKAEGRDEADDAVGEANGGEDQEKVTICHKGKTLTVGEPAQADHLSHGDTVGTCPEGAVPGPPGEKPGPGVAQNGDGGNANGQKKVMLCHKGKTLTVGEPAVDAHLRHGDTIGACG